MAGAKKKGVGLKSEKENKAEMQPPALALGMEASDNDEDQITELTVNEKFAKGYLERKRKEELTKLERQRAYLEEEDDDDESDSETEDEDGEELTAELDTDIKKTLRLIRNRDPIIYDQSVAFFKPKEGNGEEEDDSGNDGKTAKESKKTKEAAPLYYKDLVRQQVIAGDIGSEDEEEQPRVITYGEEQQQLKQEFLRSLKNAEPDSDDDGDVGPEGDDDLEGGLFSIRAKSEAEQQEEAKEYAAFQTKYGSKLKKNELDPDAFLENYLNSGGWKEKKNVIPRYEDIVKDDEEDAEELEKMEEFEHAYNFRFEEEGSGLIQTYARNIDDTMRRKDDSRKRKREERKERKALERLKKEEELKRLKNLKQAEIQSKLQKIAKLMGSTEEEERLKVLSTDLEGDFDPEEYDKRMQQIFDEEYYNEDETMEKPTWDDEEDKDLFAGLPVDEDEDEAQEEEGEASVSAEPDATKYEEEDVADVEEGNEVMDEEEYDDEVNGEKESEEWKHKTPDELQLAKQKYLDELYGLDYEDLIGDLKCRFKYREVQRNDFGLTAEEIMAADDKDLKQLVALKRIAPYQDEEYNINRKKVKYFKRTLAERQAEEAQKKQRKQKAAETDEATDGDAIENTVASESASAATKTKKRKRTKKTKQNGVDDTRSTQDDSDVDPEKEIHHATELSTASAETSASQKKKNRRGKKKSGKESNAFASTGLSSSRLESYKLIKSSGKK